jgi:hypothetical protein
MPSTANGCDDFSDGKNVASVPVRGMYGFCRAVLLIVSRGEMPMKRLVFALALPFLFVAGTAFGESPINSGLSSTQSEPSYEQAMRQSKDPRAIVHAKAEFKAEQRLRRIESLRWFGFSNSRPQANCDPYNYDYAPKWVSNPGFYPSRWNGVGR